MNNDSNPLEQMVDEFANDPQRNIKALEERLEETKRMFMQACKERDEARKDTERLDWLQEQGKPETYEDTSPCTIWVIASDPGCGELRATIDAARKGTT